MRRVALVAALVALFALATGATTAAPKVGGALGPTPLIVENLTTVPAVEVVNEGTGVEDVALSVTGEGWALARTTLSGLAPAARVWVPLTVGPGTAVVLARFTPAFPTPGQELATVAVSIHARHRTLLEAVTASPLLPIAALLLLLLAALVVVRQARRVTA